jgi:hypothetical protein
MSLWCHRICPVLLLALSAASQAQTVSTTLGGSEIYNAYGIQTEYRWHNITGWTGLGYSDGVKVGAYAQVPLMRNSVLGVGDQMLSAYLDVDEFDTHAFTVRGLAYSRQSKDARFELFTGLLSEESELPYLHMSSTTGQNLARTPVVALLYQRKLSQKVQVHAFSMGGDKFTSIESVGWRPSNKWNFAAAGGVGSNAPYLAGSGDLHLQRADLRASYTVAGKDFHRDQHPNYSTEPIGFNARFSATPAPAVKLILDREQQRSFVNSMPVVQSTFNSASLLSIFKGFQFSPSVSTTTTSNTSGQTLTETFSASRRILPFWRSFGAYIYMQSPAFQQKTYVATNEFRLSPRLAIRQNYNRINGQNNFSCGGQWLSNRLSFSVDQQVYVSPLAPAFGARSVFQAWTFNIRLRGPHATTANVNTFVDPQGHMEWGGYLSGLRYDAVAPVVNTSPTFSKYILRGSVVDETGNGVWGIAVSIGGDMVISDENGEFFLHVKGPRSLTLVVDPTASLQPKPWRLQTAPPTVQGWLENGSGEPVRLVVNTRQLVAQN